MNIRIQSTVLVLLLLIPILGTAYAEGATGDSTTTAQTSRDKVYDITDEITTAFEASPTVMPAGSTGTVLKSIPVIDGGRTWWEIQYQNKDGTTTTGWSAEDGLKSGTEIAKGDKVKTTSNLKVRDDAGGAVKKALDGTDIIMPAGITGTIISDHPNIKNGNTWWEIQYQNKDGTTTTGWSADIGLKKGISSGDEVKTTSDLTVRESPDGISVPSPGSLNTYDKAGIISYGKHQFILASSTDKPGSLYNVLVEYTTLSKSETSKNIVAIDPKSGKSYLQRVEEKDATLANDKNFLGLLKEAASEDKDMMTQAQDDAFKQIYYNGAKQYAEEHDHLTSALAIVIYTDTNVQGGLIPVSQNTAKRFEGKEIGKDYTEQDWLKAFLEERATRLKNLGLDSALYRVDALQKLVSDGNLDLKHGDKGDDFDQIALGNKGKVYAIDAPLRDEEAVGTTTGSGDVTLAADMLRLGATLKLGAPKLSPPSSEMTPSAMSSSQYSEVPTGPNGNNPQTGYAQVGNMYVWYLDQLHWEGQQDPAHPGVPAVPLHFVNGALNTVGYDWINLPYSQTGITYDQGYADWARSYVDSNGGFNGVAAGAGPL